MKTTPLLFLILAITGGLGFPVDQNAEDTDFPILKPSDSETSEDGKDATGPVDQQATPAEDDQTEFPILKPNPDDFQVDRPEPVDENPEIPAYEQGEDQPVERPRPEGAEYGERNFPSLSEFNPRGALDLSFTDMEDFKDAERRTRKNSRLSGNFDDEDDTVVVDAASCEDLKKDCDEKNDLLSCEAYKENCTSEGGETEDNEAAEMVNCVDGIAGKGGNKADCPSLVPNKP